MHCTRLQSVAPRAPQIPPLPSPLALISVSEFNQRTGLNNVSAIPRLVNDSSVILLPLRPASLTHKNPKRLKIIHGMRPVGRKERSIDLKIFWSKILFM